MISNRFQFLKDEPEKLMNLKVDYDLIQYFSTKLFLKNTLLGDYDPFLDCELSLLKSYLVLKKTKHNNPRSYKLLWLDISLYIMSITDSPLLNDVLFNVEL